MSLRRALKFCNCSIRRCMMVSDAAITMQHLSGIATCFHRIVLLYHSLYFDCITVCFVYCIMPHV